MEPRLRRSIPADSLGYIRVPNLWGVLSEPKGSLLNGVLEGEPHALLIETIRKSMGERFLDLAHQRLKPAIELFFMQLASPLEILLELPENAPPQMATLLLSANLSIDSLEGFRAFLTDLAATGPQLKLMNEVTPEGYAALATRGMPIFMHYDPEARALKAMIGMSVNDAALKERLAGIEPVEDHPMYAFENEIDESRQGFFIWLNTAKIMPTLKASMPPPRLEALEKWGLTEIRAIALGWGVSRGKGRLKLSLDAPKAGYRKLFPDIENDFALSASGMPKTVFTVSLPLPEIAQALKEIGEKEARPALPAALERVDQACLEKLDMPLADILAAFGPEMVFFTDEVDSFAALKIRNREKMTTLLMNLSNHPDATLETHEREGRKYHHLRLPSTSALIPAQKALPSAGSVTGGILESIRTHLFWTQENGYLVFASVPQALYDRAAHIERVSIRAWIEENQDATHSVINLSTRLPDTPSKIYYTYIELITLLADLADEEVDLFSLPSARQAALPPEGVYGIQFDWSDPVVSLGFTFENNPLEFLLVQNTSTTIAAIGVLSAIAIPNFIAYKKRAYDSTANAAIKNAYTAAQAYFTDYPDATITVEALKQAGYRPDEGVILKIEDGKMGSLRMSAHHEKGTHIYAVDQEGRIEKSPK